jgi:hypothetical protein
MEKYNQRVQSILDNYSLETINSGLCEEDSIYQEQINAAKELILNFSKEDADDDNMRRRHQILKAQMQSGKTGVVSSVINLLHDTSLEKYFGVNKYFILTGMNDVGLGLQTLDRVKKQVHFADDTNVDNGKNNDAYECQDCRIIVMRNSNIRKSSHILENCVVFIDESHYGAGENSVLTNFFRRSDIDWKNKEELQEKNIYLVSVSATPFSESHSDLESCKEDVVLKVTEDYYGISEFYRSGQISPANTNDFKRNSNGAYPIVEYIRDAYDQMDTNSNGDKIGLIFIRAYREKPNVIKNNSFIQQNFKIKELSTKEGNRIDYNSVNEELKMMFSTYDNNRAKPVLFLIKGAYRAGVTINMKDKDYINMIYDNSSEMAATYQGLAGRLSGYRFTEDDKIKRTKLYLNIEHVEKYDQWVDSDLNRTLTPGVTGYVSIENDFTDFNNSTDKWGGEKIGVFNLPLCEKDYNTISSLQDKTPKERKREVFEISKDLLNGLNINIDFIGEVYLSSREYKKSIVDRFGGNNNSVPTPRPQNSNFFDITGRKEYNITDINKIFTHVYVNHETKEIVLSVGKVLRQRKMTTSGKYFQPHMNTQVM